jgi:hypothetical protein
MNAFHDEYEVTLSSSKTGENPTTFRVRAYNEPDAIQKTVCRLFGFRARYLPRQKAVARIGRHGRTRKILRSDAHAVARLLDDQP